MTMPPDDNASVKHGPKLTAFHEVVAKYKQSPDEFAALAERERYNEQLKARQETFACVPFDLSNSREEAVAIVRLWQSELEGGYSGELPRELQINLEGLYAKILEAE